MLTTNVILNYFLRKTRSQKCTLANKVIGYFNSYVKVYNIQLNLPVSKFPILKVTREQIRVVTVAYDRHPQNHIKQTLVTEKFKRQFCPPKHLNHNCDIRMSKAVQGLFTCASFLSRNYTGLIHKQKFLFISRFLMFNIVVTRAEPQTSIMFLRCI